MIYQSLLPATERFQCGYDSVCDSKGNKHACSFPPLVLKWFLFLASQVPVLRPMDLMVEATPRRVFANAHTYHINSISVNSDYETYMSADDLRINLWNFEITNQSFSILSLWPIVGCLELTVFRYEWVWSIRWNRKEQWQLCRQYLWRTCPFIIYGHFWDSFTPKYSWGMLNYQQWATTRSGLQLWVSYFLQGHIRVMN